jgi:hypothetical protein
MIRFRDTQLDRCRSAAELGRTVFPIRKGVDESPPPDFPTPDPGDKKF